MNFLYRPYFTVLLQFINESYKNSISKMSYFYSIDTQRRTEVKIKRSIFICSLKYVENISGAKEFISDVSSEHKTATHNCWAYIIGERGDLFHSSDNGEPAGTAGKPMLNALQSHDMTNIVAVVTRYYGGVKLGVRGLIDAYGESVTQAIELSPLSRLVKTKEYLIELPYSFNDTLLHQLQQFHVKILDTSYSERITHTVSVEEDLSDRMNIFLSEYQNSGRLLFIPNYQEKTGC